MEAFREIILEGGGLLSVVQPIVVLLAFAAVFGGLAVRRFSFADSKVYYG